LGRTYTWVNRHLTEGRAELRRRWVRELEAAGFGIDQIAPALGLGAETAGRSETGSGSRDHVGRRAA
jgi:hypothetical protein